MQTLVQAGPLDVSAPETMMNTTTRLLSDMMDGQIVVGASIAAAASTVVASLSLPAGRLANVGQGLEFVIWGTNDADAGAKTVVINFGGVAALTFTVTGANANWVIRATILKSGTDAQVGVGELLLTATKSIVLFAGTVDDGAAIAVNVTATNAGGGSTIKGLQIKQVR